MVINLLTRVSIVKPVHIFSPHILNNSPDIKEEKIKMESKYILFHRLPFSPMRGKSIAPKQKKLHALFLFGIVSRGDWI